MNLFKLFILFFLGFVSHSSYAKTYYLRGEIKSGTFYLYAHGMNDSLDFIKLINSKGEDTKAKINFSSSHFTHPEKPDITMIKLDYSFQIPNDFDLKDSLFKFAFKSRIQYDTTFDYSFYILSEPPISSLELVYPKDNAKDVILKPTFQWTEEIHPAIRFYSFQLSSEENFSQTLVDTLLFSTKYTPNFELIPSTKYFWRVKADFVENQIGYKTNSFISGVRTTWTPFEIEKYHYAQDMQQLDSAKLILTDHQVGFLISEDNGVNWKIVKTPNIIPLKITPIINGKLYAPSYDLNDSRYKILKSENEGSNWSIHYTFPDENPYQTDKKFHHILQDDNFIIAFMNKIMIFDDIESMNLKNAITLDTSFITSFAELDGGDFIAVTESRYVKGELDKGDIFIISNNGKSVKKVFNDHKGDNINFVALNLLENGYLIASGNQNYSDSSFHFISIDNGETWQLSSSNYKGKIGSVITTNDSYLFSSYYGNKEPIMMSEDYGYNWANITGNMRNNNTAWDIKIFGDSILYYLSNSNILYKTNIRNDIEMTLYPINDIISNNNQITFHWQNNKRAENYNIQISENKDFKQTGSPTGESYFIDLETANNTYQFDGFIKDKTYYWRVRPFYDGRWMSWSNTIEFQIKDVSSVEFSENEFEIYPNPAKEYITINMGSIGAFSNGARSHIASIEIFDVIGILIHTEVIHPMTPSHRLNIENLTPGVYFLKIISGNGACSIVEKFVKY